MRLGNNLADIGALLEHAEWMRHLAARLVQGGDEDAVQDTWVAALRAPPDADRPARPWLARVLQNAARRRFRSARSVQAREQRCGGLAEDAPTPEELLARAEVQRRLVDLVLALDEPYRRVVLLRYVDGLSSAEIARAAGLPAATIRWQLKQGLDRLRTALDAGHSGSRHEWRLTLAPLCAASKERVASIGVLAMTIKSKLAILGCAIVLLGVFAFAPRLWRVRGSRGPERNARAAAMAARPLARTMHGRAWTAAWTRAQAAGSIAGTVFDPHARPVAGARVALVERSSCDDLAAPVTDRPLATTLSTKTGTFRFAEIPPLSYLLTATAQAWGAAEHPGVSLLPGEALTGVTLRLTAHGVRLRGQVADASGGAIAGAELRAVVLGAGGRSEGARTFVTRANSDGHYELRLNGGSYRLVAAADGYAPQAERVFLDRDQQRSFRLTPAARVSGHVIERGGGPVAGASVVIRAEGVLAAVERTTRTDGAGAFAFGDLPAGAFRLTANDGARLGQSSRQIIVGPADSVSDVLLELAPGCALAGIVRSSSGSPVGQARVFADDSRATVLSDAAGRFRLLGLELGPHVLHAQAAGFAPEQRAITVAAKDHETVVLVLTVEVQVRGRVLISAGRSLANAPVTAFVVLPDAVQESVLSSGVTRTDAAGRFQIGGLGAGELRLEAEHPEHGRGLAGPVVVNDGQVATVDVRMGAGAWISGRVRWDDGTPAAAVFVLGRPRARPALTGAVDADGSYRLGPFVAGTVALEAFPETDALGPVPGQRRRTLVLRANEQLSDVNLVLNRRDRSLRGVVRAPDGSPVAGAAVGVAPLVRGLSYRPFNKYASAVDGGNYQVLSGADGTFILEHLPREPVLAWATHPDHPEADVDPVAADATALELRFVDGATLAGRVVGPDGRPIPEYTLATSLSRDNDQTVQLRTARGYVQDTQAVRNASGAFEVSRLHAARYDLLALTPDGRGGRLLGIPLTAGQTRSGLTLVVGNTIRLRGRIVDGNSREPIAGVGVSGWLALLVSEIRARTDAAGAFVLDGVVPGSELELSICGDGVTHGVTRRPVRVPAGEREVDVGTIALPRGSPSGE